MSSLSGEELRFSAGSFPNENEDNDEGRLIIDENELAGFNQATSGIKIKELIKEITKRYQRNFMLAIATVIPTLKFVLACISLFLIIMHDTVGYELNHPAKDHHLQRGEMVFLYTIITIPITAISVGLGISTFITYPTVTYGSVMAYIGFRAVLLAIELVTVLTYLTLASLSYTLFEHLAVQSLMMTEVYSLILLKVCFKRQIDFDPLKEPLCVELDTIKTNVRQHDLRPVPKIRGLPPSDLENP